MKNIHIEIKDKNGDVVNEYYVHRLNVRDNMERIKAHREISEMDVSDEIRGHLYTCSSMAVALRDKDGERLFKDVTDDSGEIVKPAYEVFEDEMDFEEYGLLVKHYLEMNPVEASLDAKKKEILSDGYLLLVKRVCQTLHKPVFEVMQYPTEELEYWACFFSIDDNGDKPIIKPQEISIEQSMKDLIRVANL